MATHARHAGYYAAYYETLNYTFDARARAGLLRFVEELYALGAIPAVPSVEPEVLVVH
jgi:predicted solute-binding protein